MKKVHLIGTNIVTSPLGFGCAQLLRTSSAKQRQRILHAAYDAGIRHFDVARMYGLGAAERELGRFAQNKRDQLVLATKFGIDINPRGGLAAHAQGLARRLVVLFPALRKAARRSSGVLLQPRRYDAAKARESLEKSLRELGTDYVDLFLLHEPTLQGVMNSDVLEFLVTAKSQGKIRAYGVAGLTQDVIDIGRAIPELTPVVQIPNDAITRNIENLPDAVSHAVITYSPFSSALKLIVDQFNIAPYTFRHWFNVGKKDKVPVDNIAALLLRYCLRANSSGVVIFSTTKPERLQSLARAGNEDASMDMQMQSLLARIDEKLREPVSMHAKA